MAMASDPWQGHDFAILLPVLVAGALTGLGILAFLCSRLTARARGRRTTQAVWRDASLTATGLALGLYLWGCLHVLFLEDQEQAEQCELHRPEGTPALVGRRGDFIPLRLVCEASDGHDYSVVIPHYVNPSIAVLLLLALACGTVSVLLHLGRRRTTRKRG
ncbi:hypothetical protein E6R60_25325 [Streptomyces sp. A0642]|uniref:hypothetical protein n=1 Tax=Streptomyces sp. A0642 TaxID=2563100 RepID=UPI0010A256FA|nr:hypothetical protein [Streptomyces sp. A0642]THA73271.1 hypothetical protein E6R60_25325 [Streptomyces sp. A0642]